MPPAVILAGGFGTRLRGAIPDGLPKPLASVAGRPFLEQLVRQLIKAGITRIVLSTGYAAGKIEQHFGTGAALGAKITYAREEQPLGTGGAAALAACVLADEGHGEILAMNGDSYCEVDLPALIERFHAKAARGMIVVRQVEDASRYGSVEIDPTTDQITAFREKAASSSSPNSGGAGISTGWINGGIYLLQANVLAEVPPDRPVSIEREVFPALVEQGLYAFKTEGLFIDIGIPEELERAQGLFANPLAGRRDG